MALKNETEVRRIITKIFNRLDSKYLAQVNDSGYHYLNDITGSSGSTDSVICTNLSENELATFVGALSENEVDTHKLIGEVASLDKFTKKIITCNTTSVVSAALTAYTRIKETKKEAIRTLQKMKEKRELYKAARLSARQKQVLKTLGLHLDYYEKEL